MAADAGGGGGSSVLPEIDAPGPVREAAKALAAAATAIHTRADTIQKGWQGLSGAYHAPEQNLVLTAMDKPVTAATTLDEHTGKVKEALDRYADRLEELARQREQLLADIASYQAASTAFQADTNPFKDLFGIRERELMDQGQAIQGRINAWLQACDEAQLECANAIRALFGAAPLKLADRATVEETEAGLAAGLSAKGYDALARAGKAPWNPPEIWNGWSFWGKDYALGQGIEDWGDSTVDLVKTLVTGGEHDERSVMWSHMKQMGRDLGTLYAAGSAGESMMYGAPGPVGPSDADVHAASDRLTQVGKSMVGWDNWGTSGWRQAGSFAPDVALSALGGAGAARAGAAGATRGATRGVLTRSLTRIAPTAAVRVESLAGVASALARDARNTARVGKQNVLTAARNTAYRAQDSVVAAKTAAVRTAATVVDDVTYAGRATAALARHAIGIEPGTQRVLALTNGATMRVPVHPLESVPQSTRLGTAMRESAEQASTPTWQPPRFSSVAPDRHSDFTPRVAYENQPSGMLGRPPAAADRAPATVIDIKGQYRDLMPKAHETFGENLAEKARALYGEGSPEVKALQNARIEVRGRGTFFTDGKGEVVFVEPTRRTFTAAGGLMPRPLMSTDLRNPLPDTTYLVDNRTFFHTNADGWTDHVHITGVSEEKVSRGWAAQRNVSSGKPGIDAGHLDGRAGGGTGEEINLVQMAQDFNRGTRPRTAADGNNWAELERILRNHLNDEHHPTDSVDITLDYPDTDAPTWQPGRHLNDRTRLAPKPDTFTVTEIDANGNVIKPWRMPNK